MTTSYPLSAPTLRTGAPLEGDVAVAPSIESVVATYGDFVWRSLRRLGVPEHQVDDATQQVLIVFARKQDRIQRGAERQFLFVTLSNVASHVRRSLGRNREHAYDATPEVVDPAPRPDEIAEERQARAFLDRALDAMPEDLRTVFVLFELEELSAPEIAELTGLPVGTVASRLRRAREEFHRVCKRAQARQPGQTGGKP